MVVATVGVAQRHADFHEALVQTRSQVRILEASLCGNKHDAAADGKVLYLILVAGEVSIQVCLTFVLFDQPADQIRTFLLHKQHG